MIRVVPFRSPEEASRRLSFLGVPAADAEGLVADLRAFLVRIPFDHPGSEKIGKDLASRGVPVVTGTGARLLSISSRDQVAAWIRDDQGRGACLEPLREAMDRYLAREFVVPCRDGALVLGGRPELMGILNVTPDSFSDGGRYLSADDAIRHGIAMAEEGAGIIDVGGESTRPGSAGVPPDEEARRVVPVVRGLAARTEAIVSIDTTKASVARAAVEAGARIVNDTSALRDDPGMASVVRDTGSAVVLMHRKGVPATMQVDPSYESLFDEILAFFEERLEAAREIGIPRDRILVDPGVGFGKRLADNLALHRHLDELRNLGRPIVFGPSRKSFLGTITGRPVGERAFATAASVAWAAAQGAHVLRIHDVREMRDVTGVACAIGEGPEC
ncbi:MAG: dihydropteroate synthase [Deltaproteobacteria bacterium]|nr:dihydropteroate synthase [Deltaproteobacteria bacterium]